jgi:hypothetical protein
MIGTWNEVLRGAAMVASNLAVVIDAKDTLKSWGSCCTNGNAEAGLSPRTSSPTLPEW